jgi:ribosomal protection tetracycline resistance protein
MRGWEVTDSVVTLTHAGYWSPVSTAGDFRKLTPLALMRALHNAGNDAREPIEELEIEIPEDTFGAVCGALLNARETIRNVSREKSSQNIIWEVPTAELQTVEQSLPGLTHGGGG